MLATGGITPLRAWDDLEPKRQSALVIVAPNQPPDATIDSPTSQLTIIEIGQTVSFAGTATDPDGDITITGYSWDFGGGAPNSSVEDPGEVQFDSEGLFTVLFNATDAQGGTDPTPDSRQIQVVEPLPQNLPPQASIDSPAGNVTIPAGQSVEFAGTGTDPDGSIVAYSWSFPGGSPSASDVEDPGMVTFAAPGQYTVTFDVTDDGGLSDPTPDSRTITVTPPASNQPPEATILAPSSHVTIQAGEFVSFAGAATDPDGSIVGYSWDFSGGAPSSSAQSPGRVQFSQPGVYVVTFNATDDDGASDPRPDNRLVTVTEGPPANSLPLATIDAPAGRVEIEVGESVTFLGTGRDSDGRVVAYLWTFSGGAPNASTEDPGAVTFSTAGTFTVTFNVTDDRGAGDPTPPTVTVVVGGGGPGIVPRNPNVETTQPGSENRVDGHDVIFVTRAIAAQDLRADVTGDGKVDQADVQAVLAALGSIP